jgi:hypothetical protein
MAAMATSEPSASAAERDGKEAFSDSCLTCHDDPDPPAPDLVGPLSPDRATLAMNAVINGRMPPPSEELGNREREVILEWLCTESGRNEFACSDLLRTALRRDLVRPPAVTARLLHREFGVEPWAVHVPTAQTATITLLSVLSVAGVELCKSSQPSPAQPSAKADQPSATTPASCVKHVVQRGLEPVQ